MQINRTFDRCVFSAVVIRRAIGLFDELLPADNDNSSTVARRVHIPDEKIKFDSDEEFLAELGKDDVTFATYMRFRHPHEFVIAMHVRQPETEVQVELPERSDIERVMNVFAENADAARIPLPPARPTPAPPPPTVFVGHGHNPAWRDLKDHLHDLHGYEIEAYESGARAGHTIRDILNSMTSHASFAVLVMTAEDEQADGSLRARENVVHEVGLFQGALGFDRAIVALQEGVEPFSNLQGIHQLRFENNIREIFGDVLATLRREFPGRTP